MMRKNIRKERRKQDYWKTAITVKSSEIFFIGTADSKELTLK
jgi:hypothetical protein